MLPLLRLWRRKYLQIWQTHKGTNLGDGNWRCNSDTMSQAITARGTIASYGEQWIEVLVLLVKHTAGERCCGQRWGHSRGFRVFVSDLKSLQWDWRKLQFWRKKHRALKAAKQHHVLQRTRLWRDVSTHVADFTVILFEGTNRIKQAPA